MSNPFAIFIGILALIYTIIGIVTFTDLTIQIKKDKEMKPEAKKRLRKARWAVAIFWPVLIKILK